MLIITSAKYIDVGGAHLSPYMTELVDKYLIYYSPQETKKAVGLDKGSTQSKHSLPRTSICPTVVAIQLLLVNQDCVQSENQPCLVRQHQSSSQRRATTY